MAERPAPDPDSAPRCGAKGKRSGKPCRGHPITLPDGTKTRRCRMHGGTNEALPAGDPRRGGRPTSTRLYTRHLQPDELDAYEQATAGGLDAEIKVAKAHLDWAIRQWAGKPSGGLAIAIKPGSREVRIKPWIDVVGEHYDNVRRLELARAAIMNQVPTDETDLAPYEEFLKIGRQRK